MNNRLIEIPVPDISIFKEALEIARADIMALQSRKNLTFLVPTKVELEEED